MPRRAGLIWGPTYKEMLDPSRLEAAVLGRARAAVSHPLEPANLYNITWKRPDGVPHHLVLPRELTGVEAQIVALLGCRFPTGSHKVCAAYATIVEAQLRGETRPGETVLVFPSTGNYGIGGAWVGGLMGYDTVVVLPELMSRERFEMLESYGARVLRTPGGESNVREIFETCREIGKDPRVRIMDQFSSMANYRFHYYCTGNTAVELVRYLGSQGTGNGKCAAFVSAMGSGGTIGAGDRLKQAFPETRIVGLEPVQCPTLSLNGYGDHDIQGIGDRHVTWIHNVFNMDALMCIDDMECLLMLQALTHPAGREYLVRRLGVPEQTALTLSTSIGISGVCNVLGAIKTAKYYGLSRDDVVVTVLTDGIDRYGSVMDELSARTGAPDETEVRVQHERIMLGAKLDYVQDGTVFNRERWFNLKYFTWVEQRGKTVQELDAQREKSWWEREQRLVDEIDSRLESVRGTAVF